VKPSVKITLVALAVGIAALIVALLVAMLARPTPASAPTTADALVLRDDSRVLDDAGPGAVTVVEFLDFECEACGSFYPVVEELRETYRDRITYVIRYFPLPGHTNSRNAAIAAEAAAQQGYLEEMYDRLFETQPMWGEAKESRAELFRSYAEELSLDMATYDAAVADPATAERVQFDVDEGVRLGVESTPTFFVDGEIVALKAWSDLEDSVVAALRGAE